MLNKGRTEKQLLYSEVERLKKINRKLKDENRRLREGIEDIEKYREKYKELIGSIEMIKKQYAEKLKVFDGIEELYRKEYRKLKNQLEKIASDVLDVLGLNNDCIVVKGAVWGGSAFGKQKRDAEKRNRR